VGGGDTGFRWAWGSQPCGAAGSGIRATLSAMGQSTPTTTRARALERVREIIFQVLGDRDVRVYLFGSSVTGRIRRSSDIDIAIDPLRALPPALLAELRERLEESEVPYDVDIVDLSAASPEIRASVEREGAQWRG
jgi:predicted nucleotidyltransferase